MELNEITGMVISKSIDIHRKLGPGLLESVYHTILAYELRKAGLTVLTEIPVPIVWDDLQFDEGFRADLLVGNEVIIELKSVEAVKDVHKKQLLTYLKLADKRLGLLINFNEVVLKDGITRIVNNFKD